MRSIRTAQRTRRCSTTAACKRTQSADRIQTAFFKAGPGAKAAPGRGPPGTASCPKSAARRRGVARCRSSGYAKAGGWQKSSRRADSHPCGTRPPARPFDGNGSLAGASKPRVLGPARQDRARRGYCPSAHRPRPGAAAGRAYDAFRPGGGRSTRCRPDSME